MVDYKINNGLLNAMNKDELIIFVGSGMSKNFDFPDWKTLIKEILDDLILHDNDNDKSYQSLKSVLEVNLLSEIEVLDKILEINSNNKKRVYNHLRKMIDKDLTTTDLNLIKKLGEITTKIVTTNYDRLLETATGFSKIVHNYDYPVAILPEYEKYVFKLHGCVENPSTCILFSEDYNDLYKENTAALERIKSLVADKTILFVGFSFNDPFIKKTFQYIYDVYKSYNKKHYIISTDNVDFSQYGLLPITIDDWGKLPSLLDFLIRQKGDHPDTYFLNERTKEKLNINKQNKSPFTFKIAILISLPLDEEQIYSFDNLEKYFNKYQLEIDYFYLSEENLNELDNYNYIFIYTKPVQNQILVEDENFRKKSLSLNKLEEQIGCNQIQGIFLFLSENMTLDYDPSTGHFPVAIIEYEENLSDFLFKLFKKTELDKLKYTQIFNEEKFVLTSVNKGISKTNYKKHNNLSDRIDKKSLNNFIGRKIDIADLTRKILDSPNKIITLKGSGGIGKTTLIKKVAIEFYERGFFKDGIDFVDCESISDYQSFEQVIAKIFKLDNILNFVEYARQFQNKLDKILILDNYETLHYLNEVDKIKEFVSFLSNYSTVVITSREWLDFEFEEQHELRNFTTIEAFSLFEKLYTYKIREEEKKLLKEEIIGKLLNNNPLAIKIITKNLPKSSSMIALRDEISENFFKATHAGYIDIFDSPEDENIERSESLYQSINYSYEKLNSKEQLVFEILSLFPQGIHIEYFKDFFNGKEFKKDIYKITNKEIKSLDNKSLIEINGGFINLQSILGRFADYQFNKRTEKEKGKYYKRAFQFNSYLLTVINSLESKEESHLTALKIFDKNEDNFIKSFYYIDKLDIDNKALIKFVNTVGDFSLDTSNGQKFLKAIESCHKIFEQELNGNLLKDVLTAYIKFYSGQFQEAYEFFEQYLSLEKVKELDLDSNKFVNRLLILTAVSIYGMEGKELNVLQFIFEKELEYGIELISNLLFKIGEYRLAQELSEDKLHFFDFELQYNRGEIRIDAIENHLESYLYNKEYVEIIQINYIKTKMGLNSKEVIEKLVVTNPYTSGLKSLMLALVEDDSEIKLKLYKLGIQKLEHIKYYYVEAIYFYSKYLYEINSNEFDYWYELGKKLAEQYNYRFHLFNFDQLVKGTQSVYDENYYKLTKQIDFNAIIAKQNKLVKK